MRISDLQVAKNNVSFSSQLKQHQMTEHKVVTQSQGTTEQAVFRGSLVSSDNGYTKHDALLKQWNKEGSYFLNLYDDKILDQAINNSMLLENHIGQLVEVCKWTLESILYSKYYWYTKFLVHYEKKYGNDESMKQAQFKIIEEIDCSIGEVDSALLESIERELGYAD